MSGAEVLSYACGKFEEQKYEEALEGFILAYAKGYERQWILENIYNCYMAGNEHEFRKAFEACGCGTGISYEECILDFIPYREGEYYIFDKEQQAFWGIFSVEELQNTEADFAIQKLEFSDISVELDWNWKKKIGILTAAKRKKIYAICHDRYRSVSFCKIPELGSYMQNVRIFSSREEFQKYFHDNTSVYLPGSHHGTEESQLAIQEIIKQEHAYRITPVGRDTGNILLTIAIPTYNRGGLLLDRLENLLSMDYDAEIEILVSNHGTVKYKEEYQKASQIRDARLHYVDHGEELPYMENWRRAVGLSKGKYVLLVSDEDDVIIGALEHYLGVLSENPDVGIIRARTMEQAAYIEEDKYAKRGYEAFREGFLRQNYLSGMFFRRKDFIESHFEKLDVYRGNSFYDNYPHEWWFATLCFLGDYMEDSTCLIVEDASLLPAKAAKKERGEVEEISLPVYAKYEKRFEQAEGYLAFLRLMRDKGNAEEELIQAALELMIRKTAMMLIISYQFGDKKDIIQEVIDHYMEFYSNALDEFHLSEERRNRVILVIALCCVEIMKKKEEDSNDKGFEGI